VSFSVEEENERMNRACRFAAVAVAAVTVPACAAADAPEKLAQRLQKAIAAQDADAFVAEFDGYDSSDGQIQWGTLYLLRKCGEAQCAATVGPLTPEAVEKIKKGDPDEEPTAPPEGFILVAGTKDGSSMKAEIPYAKFGSAYKIVGTRPTAARLAKMKATTAQAATEESLAKGLGGDAEWKQKATPLPADGGEIGQAFLADLKPMADAVKAKDPDAAAKAAGGISKFSPYADDDGNPLPLATRQLVLRTQAPRTLMEARVLGGYVKDDQAVLTIEATNGAGSTLRGPIVLRKSPVDGAWVRAGQPDLIEIPKGL
jgi:hypothetical protein